MRNILTPHMKSRILLRRMKYTKIQRRSKTMTAPEMTQIRLKIRSKEDYKRDQENVSYLLNASIDT